MNSYEILPHTSDFRMKITGDNLKDLFYAGLEGMNSVLKNPENNPNENNLIERININSEDISMLLIDFLSEVLTLSHTNKAVFNELEFQNLSETSLIADIKGKNITGFNEDIKAATYTETFIKRNENGLFEAVIVFDI